ncbi:MAG TPA: mannonate dehydratase [Bryobacteraceae bacterium]|nr:mannonate dehydratase [Bryobacteraceae bacterium]
MQLAGGAGIASIVAPRLAKAAKTKWPIDVMREGIPKICAYGGRDAAANRALQQVGVFHVIGSGGRMPWTEEALRRMINTYKEQGMTVVNAMIGGMRDIIRGGPNRDQEIENIILSTRAAGKAGLPCIEYNFYGHRLTEGYEEELGRGGSGLTRFNYERVKDLPPLEHEGKHTKEELFKRAEYFLKAVIPEAEKANVRFALHPNDPPAPISRGTEQMFATFADWKRYLDLVKSPYNGITYDCGVCWELGEDPVEVFKYLRSRDVVNHVHYRNVVMRKPYVDYTEVWLDEGQVDMFAVMKEMVRSKYGGSVLPEHPRAIDLDRNRERGIVGQYAKVGGGGFAGEIYNYGFTKAMLLAALSE